MLRRLATVAIAGACLSGCLGRASGPSNLLPPAPAAPSATNDSNELPVPPIVQSADGVASLTLVVNENKATGQPEFQWDGQRNVAPTIEVNPGDTIDVLVRNRLPIVPPPQSTGFREYINLHFHGLTASPRKPGDDVLTMLAGPGKALHYHLHVPSNQEPGLYWYHPHVHGETSFQVGASGMSGAIIVNGLERHLPRLAKMKQRLIIVRATGLFDGDAAPMDMGGDETPDTSPMNGVRPDHSNTSPCTTKDGLTVTLNGAVRPVITIAPREKQFFRVVNATGHKTLRLSIEGEKLELVALDGFALDSYPGSPPTEMDSSLVVPPAGRAEFVVTGPSTGHANLRTLCYGTGPNGDPDPALLLAHLNAPKGGGGGDFSSRPLTVGGPLPSNAYTLPVPPPSVKRLVVFSESAKPRFFINGKSFSMRSPPMFVVRTGTVEEWRIVNLTQEVHDFHIHQIHFAVESVNGKKVKNEHWWDSFVIPHRVGRHGVPGEVTMLMDFRDPVIRGEFVFHCHILDHEDLGMMAKIEAI
jgi:suppressor of ftsI